MMPDVPAPVVAPAPEPSVGFIGLGRMGVPIAERIRAAGHPLVVHNRTRAKGEPLTSAGATWAFHPRDVGREASSRIVVLVLADARAVDRVLFGKSGLTEGLPRDGLVIDMSTISPSESRGFASRLGALGIHYVDAPVGGSVEAARNGKLLAFVGGSEEDVARARPLLDAVARRIEHLGPVGAGTSMKLVNNLVTVSYLALAAEAVSLAEGLGLDRRRTVDLLLDGGGYSRLLEQKRVAFEERRYPTQFSLRLAAKDLKLIGVAAREADREVRLAREAARLVSEGVRAGRGEEDFAAVLEPALARRARRATAAEPAPPSPPVEPS
jgi:3-hydroxyisobutyrate dehydrogenase-like beta-hydroxyacid dehydrogenase